MMRESTINLVSSFKYKFNYSNFKGRKKILHLSEEIWQVFQWSLHYFLLIHLYNVPFYNSAQWITITRIKKITITIKYHATYQLCYPPLHSTAPLSAMPHKTHFSFNSPFWTSPYEYRIEITFYKKP